MLKLLALALSLLATPVVAQTIDALSPAAPLVGTESVPVFQGSNPAVKTTTGAIGVLGSTVILTADTNIAAGTAIAINSAGHAVQTWGPAPNVDGLVALLNGTSIAPSQSVINAPALVLSSSQFIVYNIGVGAQACSIASEVITCGAIDTSVPSVNVQTNLLPNAQDYGAGLPTTVGLTGATFVAAYDDPTNSGNFTVTVGSISSNVISYGTPAQVAAQGLSGGGTIAVSIVQLSSTSFAIAYALADQSNWIVVGSISGTTITLGTPVELTTAGSNSTYPMTAVLSSSAMIVAYDDANSSGIGTVVVASVSGTAVTLGTPVTVAGTTNLEVAALTSTSFVLLNLTIGAQAVFAGSISGTSITVGSGVPVVGYSLFAFNSTQAIVFGNVQGSPIIVNVSGTVVTLSLPQFVGVSGVTSGNAAENAPAVISPTIFIFVTGTEANTIFEETSGGVVSLGIDHQLLLAYWLYTLDSTHALALLLDQFSIVSARIINIEQINPSGPVAFASSAVTSGNTGTFTTSGVATGFSGLTAGASYYVNGDGTLTTANTGHPACVALSASTCLIGRQ